MSIEGGQDLKFLCHHVERVACSWEPGSPQFAERLEQWLGPTSTPEAPLLQHHMDLAAAVQRLYVRVFIYLLRV